MILIILLILCVNTVLATLVMKDFVEEVLETWNRQAAIILLVPPVSIVLAVFLMLFMVVLSIFSPKAVHAIFQNYFDNETEEQN